MALLEIEQLFGQQPLAMKIAIGCVGWDNDPNYVDVSTQQGVTLIRVQLYWGRNPIVPIDKTRAQGYKILAQLGGPLWFIPGTGTKCTVAFPDGMENYPGAPIMLNILGGTPNVAFDTNGNATIQGAGMTTLNLMGNDAFVALSDRVDSNMATMSAAFNGHMHPTAGTGAPSAPTTNPLLKIPLWDGSGGTAPSSASSAVKAKR